MPSLRRKKHSAKGAPREFDAGFDFDIPVEPDKEAESFSHDSIDDDGSDSDDSSRASEPHEDVGGESSGENDATSSDDSDVASSNDTQDGANSHDSRSSTSSFGDKKVWTRPARDAHEPLYTQFIRLFEDPEPFDHWAKRIRLPEAMRQDLLEQEHHARHRREAEVNKNTLATPEGDLSDFKPRSKSPELYKQGLQESEQYFSRSLGCLKLNHIPRRAVIRLVASRAFNLLVVGCILTSAACLGLMDPMEDPVKDVIINEQWKVLPGKPGCTFKAASNYDSEAQYDDGTCDLQLHCGSCSNAKEACRLYSFSYRLRCHYDWGADYAASMHKRGCMNPYASNYDKAATINLPGSCGNCSRSDIVDRGECMATGHGSWKSLIYWTDFGLLIFFTAEMAMKLLAVGLILEPHSYLRIGWNWLDIVVVLPAWLPDSWLEEDSTLRIFRLFRPLRTINRFTGLRRLTATLLAAIPQLTGLLLILLIYFLLLAITGVQLWSGRWKQTCVRAGDASLSGGNWSLNVSVATPHSALPTGQFCDVDRCTEQTEFVDAPCVAAGCHGNDQCVKGFVNPFEFEDLRPDRISNVTDIMSFDSVPDALPVILQVFTLASWQNLMHITQDTSGDYCVIYFIAAVVLGPYFLVQLFVAILKENFDIADTVDADGIAHFVQVDRDGSGELDRDEIMRIFLNAGLYLHEEEFDIVFADMDPDANGLIELGEFLDWLRSSSETAAKLRKKMSVDENLGDLLEGQKTHNSDILVDANTDEMVSSAKHKLKLLSTSAGQVEFSMLFDYYNVDGDESLSLREFRTALRRDAQIAPSHMSNAEIEELFNQIDEDGSGSIGLAEFETWMAIEDLKLPPVDQLLQRAMKQYVVKESCFILSIKREGTTQDFTLVENAMQKHEASRILKDFVLGTGFRQMHVNYQPKLRAYSIGGFRSGKHSGHSGPPVITISEKVIEPLVGHSVCFETDADLRQEITSSGAISPVAVVGTVVVAAEVVALGRYRTKARLIITSTQFKMASVLCITANIVVLMVDHYGIDQSLEAILVWASHMFTLVFLAELVVKGLGSTHHEFWKDGFNLFEIFIVVTGLLELYAEVTAMEPDKLSLGRLDASKTFRFAKLCRAFRVLRVLRLVGAIKSMRTVVEVVLSTLWDLSFVLVMLGLFLYTFTVLGMQLYGAKLVEPDGMPPRAHWDNFHMAAFTTFQIMTLDGYDTILYDCIRLRGPWTTMYFVTWIFIGAFVLVNLLLVTILDAYAAASTRFADQEERLETQEKHMLAWSSKDYELGAKHHQDIPPEEPYRPGSSAPLHVAYKFSEQRKKCRAIITAPAFDNFFILLVLMNMVVICYDTPWLDPDSVIGEICSAASAVFTLAFCIESAIKIFAGGLYMPIEPKAPEAAYLGPSNPSKHWNWLDMLINIISIIDSVAQVASPRGGHGRFFQSCRAFRTLRLVSRVKGLKVLFKSIVLSIVSLYGVIGVMLLVWLVFGLSCVTFLKGRLYRCTDTDPAVEGQLTCVGSYVSEFPDGTIGLMDRSWHNPPVHFDDIFSAMYTLFEMSSMNDWVVKARNAMDHTFLFKQPVRESNPMWAYFMMMFIIVNNFFLVNLFIGVIYTKYLKIKFQGIETLTKYQKEWLDIMVAIDRVRPLRTHVATRNDRLAAFQIATSEKFEAAMMFVIILNIVTLAFKHDGETSTWTTVQDVLNFACTVVFTAEMLLKIYAFGIRGYWSTAWNRFDCVVVVTSWVDIASIYFMWAERTDPTPFRIIRIARVVGRITRVFKASKVFPETAILIDTFCSALDGLLYVTMLITLILFVFAVIAMNLFGQVELQGCMTERKNFRTVPRGMLTLFGVATGDGFSCMVHSVMVSEIGKSFAIKGACSEELGTCGDSVSARMFFMFFKPIVMFTTIEMFVHIVLDRYEQLTKLRELKITAADLHAFVAAWQRIDNEATGSIPVAQAQQMIDELNVTARGLAYEPLAGEEPISLHELRLPERADGRMSRYMLTAKAEEARDDPTYTFVDPQQGYSSSSGSIHFHELLYGLCERKCGTPMPKGCSVVTQARANLSKRMPTVAHVFTRISRPQGAGLNTRLAETNQLRSMEFDNPISSASVDQDQDPVSSFAQALFGANATNSVDDSNEANVADHGTGTDDENVPNALDLAQALFGGASGGEGLFGGDSNSSAPTVNASASRTFDVEELEPSSSTFDVEESSHRTGKKGRRKKKK